jgi:hypothetical protein
VKIIIRLPFILTAILISAFASSQSAYREGFVVNNSGDTTNGWIDYRQWERNPGAISFKKELSVSAATQFNINDLTHFVINGADRYTRAVVQKDLRPVDPLIVSEADVDSTVTDTVFLRILLDGTVSLYELIESRPHYYIKETGKEFTELIYKVRINEGRVQSLPLFQNQLRNLLITGGKPDHLKSLLSRIRYNAPDLVKATESINKLLFAGTVSYKVKKPRQSISFYAGGGLAHSTLKFSGDKNSGANLKYSNSFQPLLTAGIDWYVGRNNQRFLMRFDLTWYSLGYKGTDHPKIKDTITYNLKLNTLTPAISFLFNVVNHPDRRLYVGGGFAYNISSYSENHFSRKYVFDGHVQNLSPYMHLSEKWLSLTGKMGFVINKKFEMAVTRKFRGQFSNFLGMSLKSSIHTFNVNYHF